ncbi:MAG: LAGLIDADG family homing endonuclease, partial [Candidatus Omnitrophica bacterium]|nr:LAGLIDADG family homing endonuclease [Candidatus Omnitrophota bacterium]
MLDSWYVTGFADGEAAFTYSRSGGTFGLYFAIRQREDNKQIIEDIQAYFNYVGNIYHAKESEPTAKSGFTQPSVYYRVTKINELSRIIEHFDKYPLKSVKKFEAYRAWREMVLHKLNNYRAVDYDKLRTLAEKLSALNS